MRWDGDRVRFSPSDLTVYLTSEFASWMDRWWLARQRDPSLALPIVPAASAGIARDLPLFAAAAPATTLDCRPDTPGEDDRVLFERGAAHERTVLEGLRAAGTPVTAVNPATQPVEATRAAMAAGIPALYQPHLAADRFEGRPDFLFRTEIESGRFIYEPGDAKLALAVKPEHAVQLCLYAWMLERWQGIRPRHAHVLLGDGSRVQLELELYMHYVGRLTQAFLQVQDHFDARHMPHPGHGSDHGRWTSCAANIIAATDHVRAVAGIRTTQVRRLERAGIRTMTQLAAGTATPGELAAWSGAARLESVPRKGPRAVARPGGALRPAPVPAAPGGAKVVRVAPGIQAEALAHLSTQARLQIESRGQPRPRYEVRPHLDRTQRRGLALVPPESPLDVFFDMEGHPLPGGNWEYLFGAVHIDAPEPYFVPIWALPRTAEQAAFEQFVDTAHARWLQDPRMHIYHYNQYEVAALRRLMGKYGSREDKVDDLLRHEVFVDLLQVVRQGLVIGTAGYSLKDIESLYRPHRAGDVRTAQSCMAAFERWIDTPDSLDPAVSATLRAIAAYNQEDCASTLGLARWLRGVQKIAAIAFVPSRREELLWNATPATAPDPMPRPQARSRPPLLLPPGMDAEAVLQAFGLPETIPDLDAEAADDRHPSEKLIARLEDRAAAAADPEEARIARLLAHLVGFHRREWKPAWWRIFDRAAATTDELAADFDCLAGLERVNPVVAGASNLWDYRYDADQDTKLDAGDRCCFASDVDDEVKIESIDPETGSVTLTPLNITYPPDRVDLIKKDIVPIRALANAVFSYAEAWADGTVTSPAVDDLLRRNRPRIAGRLPGPIAAEGPRFMAALTAAVRGLQNSTLCIQGPPGTGKTHKSSEVILELLREGKVVGVMANAHKAILNLMHAVLDRADENDEPVGVEGARMRLVKIAGDARDPDIAAGRMGYVKDNNKIAEVLARRAPHEGLLVGGSAWCMSNAPSQCFDVLFVDEAGQVSLANLVAAGLAARNLVLVGDQMQLAQPLQGTHPGESGQSALEYLLQGQATIPDDMGVFLSTTLRMHPDICGFISEAVYEGRLRADPRTEIRRLVYGARIGPRVLRRSTGIVWVPVLHEGNSQASDEEVDAIAALAHELYTARFRDERGVERPMTLADVLFVAPYNMQVRRLQRRLRAEFGGEPRVGSVDRFQGLQAPAVVISMCASALEDVPRGLEFLLSPNRLNVAVSRAQCLAVVVGSPTLPAARCNTLEQMRLLDLYCRLVEAAERPAAGAGGLPGG